MKRAPRIALKIAVSLIALLLAATALSLLVLRTDWFHEKVRQRIVAELERVTGGRAELGGFAIDWGLLTIEFRDLTLRGTEPASAPPLLRAKSIAVGLKIISLWKKEVDLETLTVRAPLVNVTVAADGSTNIPEPKIPRRQGKAGLEPLLDWKIARFALENGAIALAEKRIPLNARGSNLRALFSYDATGPRYKGQIELQPLEIDARPMAPFSAGVYLTLGLEKNRIEISKAKIDMRRSYLEASGSIENLAAPKALFRFQARAAVDQIAPLLKIGAAKLAATQGTIDLAGTATFSGAADYLVNAGAIVRGLEVRQDLIRIAGIRATSRLRLDPGGLTLDALALDALHWQFTGKAALPRFERFAVEGTVHGFGIEETLGALAQQLPALRSGVWSGVASGAIRVEGPLHGGPLAASAKLAIAPAPGGIPVQGSLDADYDGRAGTLRLGSSRLSTPGVQLDVSGTLGAQLRVHLASTNLDDLLPAVNVFSRQRVGALPVRLQNGAAVFDGSISGPLAAPEVAGGIAATNFVYGKLAFERFSGQIALNRSSVRLQNATLARGAAQAQISGSASLSDWRLEPAAAIDAAVTLRGAEISELMQLTGQPPIPVRGGLALSAHVSGTLAAPAGSADFTLTSGEAYRQPFDRAQGRVEYSPRQIKLTVANLTMGPAHLAAGAVFEPARPGGGMPDFRNGRLQFQLSTNEVALERIESVKRLRPELTGGARASLFGSAVLQEGAEPFALRSLNGEILARGLRVENRPVGDLQATAKTQGSTLLVHVDSNFLHSKTQANGQWRLEPGYPGEATAQFSQVSLGAMRQWLGASGERNPLNLDGSVEGKLSASGPALEPRKWKAAAEFTRVEVFPLDAARRSPTGQRIVIRNEGPVAMTLADSRVTIVSAHFSGPSTDLKLTGGAMIEPRIALDLRANGDLNLAVLENFDPDLEVAGAVTANASIRGSLDRPQINGQLDVKRASVHLADITTGISGANGTILFNGSQATIQSLTGSVGGGRIQLTGDIGLAGPELSYRVDATARDVRVRYPEGVSTSANADLSLRGTSQRSTLSGLVTVLRTGFTPRTDFSSILFQASQPVRTLSARPGPLSGMRFDVRLETAPDISFESAFAQDIEVEGSLRLQGTPYNPVVLGRVNITQGQINFFGNKYTINQGSITFANPVRIEPTLNMDLETKVQGIDVILTISGPVNKLNVTPRSDPPLQYAEVLALLATGSAPTAEPTLAAQPNTPTQSFTQLGASALIGQVVANPVSSRLQRFFGVSNLKINPQFAGVENNPQARLTLEQQVAQNVTFTYITNLASSNQQIVRIEWALNKNWSVIAVRDENGLFGMDFLFKKRFK